jgi:hypothetical protein
VDSTVKQHFPIVICFICGALHSFKMPRVLPLRFGVSAVNLFQDSLAHVGLEWIAFRTVPHQLCLRD